MARREKKKREVGIVNKGGFLYLHKMQDVSLKCFYYILNDLVDKLLPRRAESSRVNFSCANGSRET